MLRLLFSACSNFSHHHSLVLLNSTSQLIPKQCSRSYTTIFGNCNDPDRLWIGVTGAAGQKKKRARGKRRITRPKIDLESGMRIGIGSKKWKIPVLTNKLTDQHGDIFEVEEKALDIGEYERQLAERRSRQARKRFSYKLPPLLRGWTSKTLAGQSIGPPSPVLDYKFEGFDTKIMEIKRVFHMTKTFGRTAVVSCFVVTGNGKSLGGYGKGKSKEQQAAIESAKAKAGQRLIGFNLRDNGRTLWHPAFIEMHHTRLFAYPMRPGSGIRTDNRVVVDLCKLLGIKDIFVEVEGSDKNYQLIVKAFFQLLGNQEDYQQLADREQLHVVEFDPAADSYPRLVASPSTGITRDVSPDEDLDMRRYYFGGRVPIFRAPPMPGFLFAPLRVKKVHERHRFRNQWSSFLERERIARLHPEVAKPPLVAPFGHYGYKWSKIIEKNMKKEASDS